MWMQLNTRLMIALCFIAGVNAFSQKKIKQLDKVEVDILYNYYEQDGNNGAVTGGLGTEKLDNNAPQISVSIPVNKTATFGATLGLDHYTSASTANIDKYGAVTSASTRSETPENNDNNLASEDTRKYLSLNFSRLMPDNNSAVSVLYGYSKEFDVTSNYGKITWQKDSKDGNKFLSITAGVFIDKWLLIYPGEIRDGRNTGAGGGKNGHHHDDDDHDDHDDDDDDDHDYDYYYDYFNTDKDHDKDDDKDDDDHDHDHDHDHHDRLVTKNYSARDDDDDDDDDDYYGNQTAAAFKGYDKDTRFTYNVGATYGGNINSRLNASVTAEVIIQKGILNTPFHRVYFNDGITQEQFKHVKSEKLPKSRVKKALGFRANYFVSNFLVTRLFYRWYTDDFGIKASSFEIETPIKLGDGFTLYPFYRFHTQTKSDYFEAYGAHNLDAEYYTSDYDLAKFTTNKYGVGMKFSPVNGVLGFKINKKREFQFKSLEFRLSRFKRSTGLEATSITLKNTFTF
ncbi:DUF3570 domain-containing protein [Tenacibaculum finnmarkense]|uniref:DUF3570 domain-containing protein n=1 Tax=Tenacibaculum finnmarkense TaxID=2781243 RepID=UPI001EFB774A|nr:DUF3570 domain-containing protein [Tenacibaculum finnmarkense]MCG8750327.1 DUF3570 domain-containing protein [Tenacibaculum finnmarkense]